MTGMILRIELVNYTRANSVSLGITENKWNELSYDQQQEIIAKTLEPMITVTVKPYGGDA